VQTLRSLVERAAALTLRQSAARCGAGIDERRCHRDASRRWQLRPSKGPLCEFWEKRKGGWGVRTARRPV
jgi:hypothetical protein